MSGHDLERIYNGFGYSIWKCKICGMEATRLMGRFLKWNYTDCEVDCIKRKECRLFAGNDHCNLKHLCIDFDYKHFDSFPKED